MLIPPGEMVSSPSYAGATIRGLVPVRLLKSTMTIVKAITDISLTFRVKGGKIRENVTGNITTLDFVGIGTFGG